MSTDFPVDAGKFPLTDDEALAWLRAQPHGRVKIGDSAIARQWGWKRSRARRRFEKWSDAGLITCEIGSHGRSVISVVDGPAISQNTETKIIAPILKAPGSDDAGHPIGTNRALKDTSVPRLAVTDLMSGTGRNTWINKAAFLAAVALACVSGYLSILGLTAIFAAAFWPVVFMGCTIEVGKLVTAAWLSRHWRSAQWVLKAALTAMVVVLVGITSMGVFGFLAKAHIDHQIRVNNAGAGEAANIDGQIAVQEHVVADLDRQIAQIDNAIEAATSRGRSNTAMALAAQQRKIREELISRRQKEAGVLADLQVKKADADGKRKRVEAEVGPVRYLAQLLGGADTDLEKAVRLLAAVIAGVFDPLAVLLMIAAARR